MENGNESQGMVMRTEALKRITKLPCTTKEYSDPSRISKSIATDVMWHLGNIAKDRMYLPQYGIKTTDITGSVFGDNRSKLQGLFGKASCHWINTHDHHIFKLRYTHSTREKDYYVVTARDMGTSIDTEEYEEKIDTDFIIDLHKILQ
jgi:hypothetical protein